MMEYRRIYTIENMIVLFEDATKQC